MDINKVHLFFEQSGIFKNEFKQLGIPAFDYDIENNFKETDFEVDLFFEIEKCIDGEDSIFDNICQKDLIFAFFPCTYFSTQSKIESRADSPNYKNLSKKFKLNHSIENNEQRLIYFIKLCNFIQICLDRKIKLIIENPWHDNFINIYLPKVENDIVIIHDRNKLGDYFRKPTAFRFYNCVPEFNLLQENRLHECKIIESQKYFSRSKISREFANFFITNFIL